jgi:adenine deaminase
LKLITINPAKQLGVDQRVGSIEVGKDADILLYDKHPLSIYAVVQKTLVDGKVLFDRAKDLEKRPSLLAEKKRLKEKQAKEAKEGADGPPNRPSGAHFREVQEVNADFDDMPQNTRDGAEKKVGEQ